jgi:hypothetical protein
MIRGYVVESLWKKRSWQIIQLSWLGGSGRMSHTSCQCSKEIKRRCEGYYKDSLVHYQVYRVL